MIYVNILSSRISCSGLLLCRACSLETKMAVTTDKYGLYTLYWYFILLFDICRKGEKIEISQKVKKNNNNISDFGQFM